MPALEPSTKTNCQILESAIINVLFSDESKRGVTSGTGTTNIVMYQAE